MYTVVGAKGVSKCSLLVLTERKTRKELLFKLKSHEAQSVVDQIDCLEKMCGKLFPRIFRTITVDNGMEFAYCEDIERSIFGGKRTSLYYCHAYCSWERGSNECANKMVRRKIPKGSNFDDKTSEEISEIETWINNYPRRIFGYHTSEERFQQELMTLVT